MPAARISKSGATGPGSHGSTRWYIGQQGEVIYGERPEMHRIEPKTAHAVVRAAKERIEEHGYSVDEEGESHRLEPDLRAAHWHEIASAIDLLHTRFPMLDTIVRKNGLWLNVGVPQPHPDHPRATLMGQYHGGSDTEPPQIDVGGEHAHTLWHEYGHFLDDVLGGGPYGDTPDATLTPGHPLHSLVGDLQQGREFRVRNSPLFLADMHETDYRLRPDETFARAMDAYMTRTALATGALPPQTPYQEEPYSDEQLARFGSVLYEALKTHAERMTKSMIDHDPLVKAARKVQNPGSRGGVGYWDGNGNWHYGQRPASHNHPLHEEYVQHLQEHHTNTATSAPTFKQWMAERSTTKQGTKTSVAAGVGGAVVAGKVANHVQKRTLNQGNAQVRETKARIAQTYGYKVSEDAGLFAQPMEAREQTWKNVEEAIAFAHDTVPGLTDLVKRKKLHLIVNNTPLKGPDISGKYSLGVVTRRRSLTIRQDAGQTFFHEIGHFVDHSMEGGEDETVMGLGLPFSSQRKGSAASKVVTAVEKSPAFASFVQGGIERNGEPYGDYLKQSPEVFARAFNVYLDHTYTKKYGTPTPGDTIFETFTAQERATIERQMKRLLKQSTYKSFGVAQETLTKAFTVAPYLDLMAWGQGEWAWPLHKSKSHRPVQKPGSKGGEVYTTKTGNVRYGKKPLDLLEQGGAEGLSGAANPHHLHKPQHLATAMGLIKHPSKYNKLSAQTRAHVKAASDHLSSYVGSGGLRAGLDLMAGQQNYELTGMDGQAHNLKQLRAAHKQAQASKNPDEAKLAKTALVQHTKSMVRKAVPALLESAARSSSRTPEDVYESVAKHLLTAHAYHTGQRPMDSLKQLGPEVGGLLPPRTQTPRSSDLPGAPSGLKRPHVDNPSIEPTNPPKERRKRR